VSPNGQRQSRSPLRHPALVLLAAAALLLAPSLLLGTLPSHSSMHNLTWAAQFSEQFRASIVYPRWLSDSFNGLGAPTFYFYSPIAFWVDALLTVATFNAFSVSYRLSLSWLLMLWASGIAMHAWLKTEAASPRVALYGALAYMAAPYHLLDHYYRGAYAEFAAYVVLPLIALAVRQIADGRRFGVALLALSYAALPMAHLPTALLISVTVLPMHVLYRGWRLAETRRSVSFFARCALGGALGLGLAAIYLLPALTLQDWIPAETFWAAYYQPQNWFLLTPERWPLPVEMMQIIQWVAAAYFLAAIAVVAIVAHGSVPQERTSEAAFWASVCIVCSLLVAGALPWFWQVPLIAKVQFPWRLMIVVEFAAITAICLVPLQVRSRATSLVLVAAIVALTCSVVNMAQGVVTRGRLALRQQEMPRELGQFVPVGFPHRLSAGFAEPDLAPLKDAPTISCAPVAGVCRAESERFGSMRIEVDGDQPTTVTLHRFYFPAWQLDPGLPLKATDPYRLVSFTAPTGSHVYHLRRASLPEERVGWMVSALSASLLLAWTVAAWLGINFARHKLADRSSR
jgi:hypothetical protein